MAHANPNFDKGQRNGGVSFLELILSQSNDMIGIISSIEGDCYMQTCRTFGLKPSKVNDAGVNSYLNKHKLEGEFDMTYDSLLKERL